jgi:hypothetical protein
MTGGIFGQEKFSPLARVRKLAAERAGDFQSSEICDSFWCSMKSGAGMGAALTGERVMDGRTNQ